MHGQDWTQIGELTLAFLLSALVGLEREVRHKSAGLRTHAVVGLAAALITLTSKYGFSDVAVKDLVRVDPSRVAAQIVSGLGFIGGGVIFLRRDIVRGLTTAASIWLTAAVGMACGAGLVVLAVATTAGNFLVVLGFPYIERWLAPLGPAATLVRVCYEDGRGLLRVILATCTAARFAVTNVSLDAGGPGDSGTRQRQQVVGIVLQLNGAQSLDGLISRLSEIEGVHEVSLLREHHALE